MHQTVRYSCKLWQKKNPSKTIYHLLNRLLIYGEHAEIRDWVLEQTESVIFPRLSGG